MSNRKISAEEKAEMIDKIQNYLDNGWTLGSSINQVRAEIQDSGRTVPAEQTLRNWMKEPEKNPVAESEPATDTTDTTDKTNETPAAEAEDPAEEAEETAAASTDYVRRLELICRLYRGRGEAECDAVCDEILPELYGEQE